MESDLRRETHEYCASCGNYVLRRHGVWIARTQWHCRACIEFDESQSMLAARCALNDHDVNAFAMSADAGAKFVAIPALGPALVRPRVPTLRRAEASR